MLRVFLLLIILVVPNLLHAYDRMTSKTFNNKAVRDAPNIVWGWIKISFAADSYGKAKLTRIYGSNVDVLIPSFDEPVQIRMHKTNIQNSYCFRPPCYVGGQFTIGFTFQPAYKYKDKFKENYYKVFCGPTYSKGSMKNPSLHIVNVYSIGKNLAFTCS